MTKLMRRRRALMAASAQQEVIGPPIVSPCTDWMMKASGGSSNYGAIGSDSYFLKASTADVTNWDCYAWSTGKSNYKYSDLIGKTIVLDFDFDPSSASFAARIGVSRDQTVAKTSGISTAQERLTFTNKSQKPGHYRREILVGTDYTATNSSYWMRFCFTLTTANVKTTISNFKFYVKE